MTWHEKKQAYACKYVHVILQVHMYVHVYMSRSPYILEICEFSTNVHTYIHTHTHILTYIRMVQFTSKFTILIFLCVFLDFLKVL